MWPAGFNLDDAPRRAYDQLMRTYEAPRPPRVNERFANVLRKLADRLAPHSSPAGTRRMRSGRSENAFSEPGCVGS
jgi:hypothetical protein